jgi:deazaflavin-dependent oxidoreductase (nitroreductase family)
MNLFTLFVAAHVGLYRVTAGRVGGRMMGMRVLLLTTTGNKSGLPRTVPLMYFHLEGHDYVVASAGGAPSHPAWYRNLAARPDVEVQIERRRFAARAVAVEEGERARIWPRITAASPQFEGYQRKAGGRLIPVVRLDDKGA